MRPTNAPLNAPLNTILKPWYREPWPWLLMSGPAIVVVAGFFTLYLAISGADGLVVDDYYKQGKAINQALHRDDAARQADMRALITLDQILDRVEVTVTEAEGKVVSTPLTLTLVHATRSGFDHVIPLTATGGTYAGTLQPLRAGKWNVLLEDTKKQWRLQREITVGSAAIPRLELRPPTAGTSLRDAP